MRVNVKQPCYMDLSNTQRMICFQKISILQKKNLIAFLIFQAFSFSSVSGKLAQNHQQFPIDNNLSTKTVNQNQIKQNCMRFIPESY